eukprot:6442921-Amphidinium_carterae.2
MSTAGAESGIRGGMEGSQSHLRTVGGTVRVVFTLGLPVPPQYVCGDLLLLCVSSIYFEGSGWQQADLGDTL